MRPRNLLALILLFALIAGCSAPQPEVTSSTPTPLPTPLPTLHTRLKGFNCHMVGIAPDPMCTPGMANASATIAEICTSDYTSQVRAVSESTKNMVYAEYGIASHKTGDYEVDHLIPLEIGGSNDISNLWPEPCPKCRKKDKVENAMHDRVCMGSISLQDAQTEILHWWLDQTYK